MPAFSPVGVGSLRVKSPFFLGSFPPSFLRRLKNHTKRIILRIVSCKGLLGVVQSNIQGSSRTCIVRDDW